MNSPGSQNPEKDLSGKVTRKPSALDVATYAVEQLENNTLFNSSYGAVFTRDGINELEASVMVSRGHKKRGVGVMGLRRVRNPIKLAREMLVHGDKDLVDHTALAADGSGGLDIPSAQGHTQLHGATAEQLAESYGLEMVDPSYFYTKQRWDEHIRALERESEGQGIGTWDANEYLPPGTCGAVALDEDGAICAATSTGGMTNKLTGRIGDTPVVGAGFWAEEWTEDGDPTGHGPLERMRLAMQGPGPAVMLSDHLKSFLADCLGVPSAQPLLTAEQWLLGRGLNTTRAMGVSGTGNGDSFLRTSAARTVGALARWKPETTARALTHVAGSGGELQRSAGERWGRTGEGEGGMIGIECAVIRGPGGQVVDTRSDILMDYNGGGMFRAWINDEGQPIMSIWSNSGPDETPPTSS